MMLMIEVDFTWHFPGQRSVKKDTGADRRNGVERGVYPAGDSGRPC